MDCIYAVGRPEIRKEILVGSFDVDTITLWYEPRFAVGDTVMPVMVSVTVADPLVNRTALVFKDISDLRSVADLLTEDAIALLVNIAFVAVVNTPDGNVILTVSPLANSCEIFIVIVKVPVVHSALLPFSIESVPTDDAHIPLPASHIVPVSQHPGP